MGLGPFDLILGAVFAIVILLIPRRLAWVRPTARDIGVLGTTLAVIAIVIFIGAVLLGLRIMPGPAFTLGAVETTVVILVAQRWEDGLRLVPRLPLPRRMDPLVLLGIIVGVAGLVIALRAAWITDVTDVHAILRAVSAAQPY